MTQLDKYVQDVKDGILPDAFPRLPRGYDYNFVERHMTAWNARCECTKRGMWAIVDKKWTKSLAKWIGKRKCLEVMAGAGWLSNALKYHGVDIIATDDFSWDKEHKDMKLVFDVKKYDGSQAAKEFSDRNLLLVSWPPYDCNEICDVCEVWGKDKPVVYIGEDDGGCNAGELFWNNFKRDEKFPDIDLPQWDGIHDYVLSGNWHGMKVVNSTKDAINQLEVCELTE